MGNAYRGEQLTSRQPREELLFDRFVVTCLDAAAGAGALRQDKGRGKACLAKSQVACASVGFIPCVAIPLLPQKPTIDAKFAQQSQLPRRPLSRLIELVSEGG